MLGELREHLDSTRYEPRFGGRFPSDRYEQIIEVLSNIFTYLTMMTYSSKAFIQNLKHGDEDTEQQWLEEFHASMTDTKILPPRLTLILCLLVSSMHNGEPLPPYLSLIDRDDEPLTKAVLARNGFDKLRFTHPCYAALAINEITSSLVDAEVVKLTGLIKDLVGDIGFSFDFTSHRYSSKKEAQLAK